MRQGTTTHLWTAISLQSSGTARKSPVRLRAVLVRARQESYCTSILTAVPYSTGCGSRNGSFSGSNVASRQVEPPQHREGVRKFCFSLLLPLSFPAKRPLWQPLLQHRSSESWGWCSSSRAAPKPWFWAGDAKKEQPVLKNKSVNAPCL